MRLWWDELGARGDPRAARGRQRARPSSRCASTPLVTDEPPEGLAGRREGDAFVLDGPATLAAHPGWARGALHRPVARRPARRARPSTRSPASASSTSARRRAARRRTSPRSCAGRGEVVAVERHAGRAARAAGAPARALRAANVDASSRPTPRASRRRRLRPRPARPAVQRPGHAAQRTPTCAGARRREAGSSGSPRCRTRLLEAAARARCGPAAGGSCTPSARSRRARSGCASRRRHWRTRAPSRRHRRLLHCAAMDEPDARPVVPVLPRALAAADEPARPLPLRLLPAPLRAALGVPGLRRALDDRADVEHRDSPSATTAAARMLRSLTPMRLTDAPRRPVASCPPTSAACASRSRRSWTPARRVIHVDVMDGHFVPPITSGRASSRRCASLRRASLDVHLMIERPERHVEAFAEGRRGHDHRPRRGDAARPLRARSDPRGRLPRRPGAQPGHAARGRSREVRATSTSCSA